MKSHFVLFAVFLVSITGCAPGATVQITTPVANAPAGTTAPSGQINVPGVSIQVYAPGPNPQVHTPDGHGSPASILLGIWHGIISPVTLVVSFIDPNVQMYEVHNDGGPYNLGFLLGVAIVFILLGVFAGSRRR